MRYRVRIIATGAAISLAAMTTGVAPAAQGARPVQEHRAAAPVIKAAMTKSALTLSTHSVRAGLIMFKATAKKGTHILQVLHLHPGYGPQQLIPDVTAAFKGDLAAIARVDDNVDWLSGATAVPGKAGWFEVKLKAGTYFAVDQNGNGFDQLTVTGSVQKRTPVKTYGTIITYTYGFDSTPTTLPASGWVTTDNRADQPHFIEMDRVKANTTDKQIEKYIKSGAQGRPPFALKGSAGLGVISPGFTGAWKYDLKPGRYLTQCFWPDRATGMPHFFMGMWKLIDVK
jgi:hypothetical protein